MENNNYTNIRNMVRRIAKEAETPEDMEKLILSELKAYKLYTDYKRSNNIELYDTTIINGNYAIIGDDGGYDVVLTQRMVNKELVSQYKTLLHI